MSKEKLVDCLLRQAKCSEQNLYENIILESGNEFN